LGLGPSIGRRAIFLRGSQKIIGYLKKSALILDDYTKELMDVWIALALYSEFEVK